MPFPRAAAVASEIEGIGPSISVAPKMPGIERTGQGDEVAVQGNDASRYFQKGFTLSNLVQAAFASSSSSLVLFS